MGLESVVVMVLLKRQADKSKNQAWGARLSLLLLTVITVTVNDRNYGW